MGRQFDPRQRQQIIDQPRHPRRLGMHDAEEALARLDVVPGRSLQRVDEARQRGERRAQFVAGIGDEIGAHFLDPAQRRLVVEGHQHAFVGAAEHGRHRHRRDDQFHPAVDRHVVEIGGAPRFRARDRLAQRGDDFGRAQRELGELVLAQRRRQLRRGGIEVKHAAGAVEQHRGIGHAGDDGADRGGLDRIDAADVLARGRGIMQPPRHQGCGGDAKEHRAGAHRREFAERNQYGQRQPRGKQDDRRMPQPVRPWCEDGGRRMFYGHRAGFLPVNCDALSSSKSNPPAISLQAFRFQNACRRAGQAPVSPRLRT